MFIASKSTTTGNRLYKKRWFEVSSASFLANLSVQLFTSLYACVIEKLGNDFVRFLQSVSRDSKLRLTMDKLVMRYTRNSTSKSTQIFSIPKLTKSHIEHKFLELTFCESERGFHQTHNFHMVVTPNQVINHYFKKEEEVINHY